jgi:hypothetical protein
MAGPRSKEFLERFRARQAVADRVSAAIERAEETQDRHARLLLDIDARIRSMPPINVVPATDLPAPDPNELTLMIRMAEVRERRAERRRENRERKLARQRARDVAAKTPKVNTTDAFAPKRKLDID